MELSYKFVTTDMSARKVIPTGWYIHYGEKIPYICYLETIFKIETNEVIDVILQSHGTIITDKQTYEQFCVFNTEDQVISALLALELIKR